jgi:putative addiction module CopG family antidote
MLRHGLQHFMHSIHPATFGVAAHHAGDHYYLGELSMHDQAARAETVKLTDEDARYIDDQVASGRYPNAAAVLTDALRLKRVREAGEPALDAELLKLVNEAAAADARGEYVDCKSPEDFDRFFGLLHTGAPRADRSP